jgi:hypothetical protein
VQADLIQPSLNEASLSSVKLRTILRRELMNKEASSLIFTEKRLHFIDGYQLAFVQSSDNKWLLTQQEDVASLPRILYEWPANSIKQHFAFGLEESKPNLLYIYLGSKEPDLILRLRRKA